MATKTRDPPYSVEKRSNIKELTIFSITHFSVLGFVNGTLSCVSSRWLLRCIFLCKLNGNYETSATGLKQTENKHEVSSKYGHRWEI